MKRHFNRHLIGIDLRFWHDLIESRGRLVSLKKGEFFCRKGEPTNVLGFVKSGYFKYTVAGVHRIGGFAFPEALVGDYPSCMDNSPAMFDIVAGKNSEACIIDATILPNLFEEDIEAGRQGRFFMQAAYVSLANRYYDLYAKTPKERYIDLVKEYPQFMQEVPLKEIAEYLQILPNSLSRIRKELLRK